MTPALNTVAAAAVIAFVAGSASGAWLNGLRWEARYNRDLAQMYQAGVKAHRSAVESYRADLTAIRNRPRPVRRVYLCPDVSESTGGAAGADPGGLPGAARRDLGTDLYQLADDADRCAAQLAALIHAVSARAAQP